ncbi:MAG: histidinol-phosphate transaminase, partial [Actinomycetota bacterium]
MRKILPGVREDLRDVSPYVSPQRPARHRMNTNESPYPPPKGLLEEVSERLRDVALNRYPDKDAVALFDALAQRWQWPREGLWIANGSNEVFLHLFLAYGGGGRSSLTFEPTYSLHTLIPKVCGTSTVQLPRGEDFRIDLGAAAESIRRKRPDFVIVCSPNNPSGGCEPLDAVRALAQEAPGLVVVDEAYGEFAESEDTVRPLLEAHPNVVLVKTFSKAWRLAGVRIGYMLGQPQIVEGIQRVRLPYHLSTLTQLFGETALRFESDTMQLVAAIKGERDRIAVELQAMGVKTFPSRANFVLFEVEDPDGIFAALMERGVLVRNYSGYEGLQRCLRVTAGLPEETDAFLAAMKEALD